MYKLIIVDDEPEVTEGLVNQISWEQYYISQVITASNGKEAMELFEKYNPDVLVTDISMPFMNGLQLTEWVKKRYPLTKVFILSGYDEFQYAKQAIQLQVEEYILKPFSNQQFIDLLCKVTKKMDEERAELNNIQLLQEHYRLTLPLMQEKFLTSLITRQLPLALIIEKSVKYELELHGQGYVISLISVQHQDAVEEKNASSSLAQSTDLDLKLYAISNIATELWVSNGLGKVFIHHDEVVLLGIDRGGMSAQYTSHILEVINNILQSIDRYLRFPVMISVGAYTNDLHHLKYAYESAKAALDYRHFLDHNTIICIDDLENPSEIHLIFDEWKERELIRAIKLGTEQELQETIKELLQEVQHSQVMIREYEHYLLEIVTSVQRLMRTMNLDIEMKLYGSKSILSQFRKLNSIEETKQWLIELCSSIHQHLANSRQHSHQQLVENAIAYTKDNYSDHELSIATLCSHLHISAGYFSSLFKKATGMTYGGYLHKLRMETAKELLRTTDLKSFEIAERVGYNDPNYFSLSFKKYEGVSAKEYRNGLLGKE